LSSKIIRTNVIRQTSSSSSHFSTTSHLLSRTCSAKNRIALKLRRTRKGPRREEEGKEKGLTNLETRPRTFLKTLGKGSSLLLSRTRLNLAL